MLKVIVGIVIGAAIVFVGFSVLDKPEPTPEEKLKAALENVGTATQEAADAATEMAEEVGTALKTSASATATEIANSLSALSADSKAQLEALLAEWKESGVITEDGFDFNKAAEAVNDSSLAQAAKDQLNSLIELLKKNPEDHKKQMDELRKQLDI